jgi:hypothetical protein
MARPKLSSEKELDKVQEQFEQFDASVKEMTMDRMNATAKKEDIEEPKISQKEISKSKDHYLKPNRTVSDKSKFNEKFRDDYNFQKEYVQFIAENLELIGDNIELWTKPFAGVPAEYWEVPTNKPVWGPRYLAEQIKRKFYHRLKMTDATTSGAMGTTFYGQMAADTTIQRLNASPVSTKRSVFMGAENF